MKIIPISSKNINKPNSNADCSLPAKNRFGSDCFVFSAGISFGISDKKVQRKKNVRLFTADLANKLNSSKFSISDISNSVRKYDTNVRVKPMSVAPKELLFSNSLQGLFCSDLMFDEKENKFFIPKKNRNFYLKTETLKEPFGNIWAFVNAVHEFTHVLQCDDENANKIALFNNYIVENKENIDEAINQISLASGLVSSFEEDIASPFIKTLSENENIAFERLKSGRTDFSQWLCRKNKIDDFGSYVREKINSKINLVKSEYNTDLDEKLFNDLIIKHLEREIEAYENENTAFKACLKIDNPKALTRIQLYQNTIDLLKGRD